MKFPLRNTPERYGLVAQVLHWAVVLGVTLQFIWIWRIDRAESIRQEFALVVQHKSIGMTVLALMLLRLVWRAFNRPPSLPAGMAGWERKAARVTHWALYALLLTIPLAGWAWSSAAGYGAEFFGLVEVPDFVPQSERLETIFHAVHEWAGITLAVLVGVHVLAALRHHFVLGDPVLRRMLPRWKQDA